MKLLRKIAHIVIGIAIIIVLIFFYNDIKTYLIIVTGIISLIGLLIDLLRIVKPKFNCFITERLLPFLFTSNEADGINSATYFFFSSALCVLIFDKDIAIISIALLTFADSLASIIGSKFGKHQIGEKTIEGTIIFFIISFIICMICFPFWKSIIVAIILSIIELTSIKLDDNLTIPITTGFLLTIIKWLRNIKHNKE